MCAALCLCALQAKRLGIKKKEPKDPGIPAAWPFKEELIAQLRAQKERADAKQAAITAQRRAEKVGGSGCVAQRSGAAQRGWVSQKIGGVAGPHARFPVAADGLSARRSQGHDRAD